MKREVAAAMQVISVEYVRQSGDRESAFLRVLFETPENVSRPCHQETIYNIILGGTKHGKQGKDQNPS